MTRLPDWPERLAALIERSQGLPLQWGVHDCATWTANAVQALTGADPLADIRGSWADQRGAARTLRRLGGLRTAVLQRLGEPLPALALAQRGDVVLLRSRRQHALGVCAGGVVLAPGLHGLAQVPLLGADAGAPVRPLLAWRI